jgi:hypothetical protein
MLISTPSEILETILFKSIGKMQRILRDKSSKKNHERDKNRPQFFLLDPLSNIPLRQRMRKAENHIFRTQKLTK